MRKKRRILCLLLLFLILSGCGSRDKTEKEIKDQSDREEIVCAEETLTEADGELSEGTVPEGNDASGEGTVSEGSDAPDKVSGSGKGDEPDEVAVSGVETEEIPASDTITIRMIGDVLLHDRLEEASKGDDGSYHYDYLFREVGDLIEEADIAIANQEVIIAGTDYGISGYPSFNAAYEAADELAENGFDVICHGTNHALDRGAKGLLSCLTYWDTTYPEINVVGIHDSAEDQATITYLEVKGIRIAVLNYTYGTNGIELPSDMPFGVDYLEEDLVRKQLREAEENADFTILCPHWGTEYSHEISQMQQKWTGIFLEEGADLIIGTHPHVIEPIELITAEDGAQMLVYYSLGNYINWTSGTGAGTADRMLGGMADICLTVSVSDGQNSQDRKVEIADFGVFPLVSHVTTDTDRLGVYLLSEYTDDLAKENAITVQDPSFSREYLEELSDRIWGEYDLSR